MTIADSSHRLGGGPLAALSAAQLVVGGLGQAVALRRRLPYDVTVLRMQGRPENVERDSWLLGTALSAPVAMLAIQGIATARLSRGASHTAARTLAVLGTAMVGGYLGERVVRERLRPAGWDAVETSVAATGLVLAAAMAALGWSADAGARAWTGAG
jgi:hypothetical protein